MVLRKGSWGLFGPRFSENTHGWAVTRIKKSALMANVNTTTQLCFKRVDYIFTSWQESENEGWEGRGNRLLSSVTPSVCWPTVVQRMLVLNNGSEDWRLRTVGLFWGPVELSDLPLPSGSLQWGFPRLRSSIRSSKVSSSWLRSGGVIRT